MATTKTDKDRVALALYLLEIPFYDLGLGKQEARVARLAALGYKAHEIGAELGLVTGTVTATLQRIKKKTGFDIKGLTREFISRLETILK